MKKHYAIFLFVLVLAVVLDLVSKVFLYNTASELIPNFVGIRYAPLNTGAAWSFLSGHIWLFCTLAFIFILIVIVFDAKFRFKKGFVYSVGLGFLLGGTIGNLVDRIALGGVRDFLFFEFWQGFPTFNVADVCLTLGCILLAIYVLFVYKTEKGKKEVGAEGGANSTGEASEVVSGKKSKKEDRKNKNLGGSTNTAGENKNFGQGGIFSGGGFGQNENASKGEADESNK